jgi:hypothetical protein
MEQKTTSSGVARRLSQIELGDWQSVPKRLGKFWKERPIVLVFIRHFG